MHVLRIGRLLRLHVALIVAAVLPTIASAGNGELSPAMIMGNRANGTGIRARVDGRWIAGDGYRPFRLQVETVGGVAAPVDRQLTIRLRPSRSYRQAQQTITKTIELPAGKSQVSEWIYVPEDTDTQHFNGWLCLGRFDERRATRFTCNTNNARNIPDSAPRVLVIDSDAPAFEERNGSNRLVQISLSGLPERPITNPNGLIRCTPQMLGQNNNSQSWSRQKSWIDVVAEVPTCTIISPTDIPPQWIGLTSADIVCISFEDLEELSTKSKQRQSLVDWTSHGGNLFVTGCGSEQDKNSPDPAKRDSLATLLGLPVVPAGGKPSAAGWKSADQKGYGKLVDELIENQNQYRRNNRPAKVEKPTAPAPPNPISYRNVQLGTVVIFSADDPLGIDDKWYWNWVYKTLGKERWMWIERNGFSGTRENPGFWKFMVPGVGLAPVKTFALLLTLFVIGIGPVSFVMLKKWRRPNWLMFTVPIAATLVTLGLIAYALLTDGLSVRGRSRTITHINQRTDREATWSRQAYYAGLPPADGLRFAGDCAVYPIDFAPTSRHMRDRTLDVTTDQHFQRGYLGARETAQFMVQRCRPTKAGLVIESEDSESLPDEIAIVNQLGGDLKDLYLRDAKGRVFHGASIKNGDRATLTVMPHTDVATRTLDISGSKCLLPPDGVNPSNIQVRGGMFGMQYYRRWNNYQAVKDPARCAAEKAVSDFYILRPNTYLAELDEPVDIPVGSPKVRWDQTMHLIVGEW